MQQDEALPLTVDRVHEQPHSHPAPPPLTSLPSTPHFAMPWTVDGVQEQPPSHVTSALPMSFQLVR